MGPSLDRRGLALNIIVGAQYPERVQGVIAPLQKNEIIFFSPHFALARTVDFSRRIILLSVFSDSFVWFES